MLSVRQGWETTGPEPTAPSPRTLISTPSLNARFHFPRAGRVLVFWIFTTVWHAFPLEGSDSALPFPVLMTPLMESKAVSGETAYTAMWRPELWSRLQQQSWLLVLTVFGFAKDSSAILWTARSIVSATHRPDPP